MSSYICLVLDTLWLLPADESPGCAFAGVITASTNARVMHIRPVVMVYLLGSEIQIEPCTVLRHFARFPSIANRPVGGGPPAPAAAVPGPPPDPCLPTRRWRPKHE